MDEPPSSPQPPPSEQEEEEEPPATPLLFLLDGCLSRDEARVQEALQEIHQLLGGGRPVSSSHHHPDTSGVVLLRHARGALSGAPGPVGGATRVLPHAVRARRIAAAPFRGLAGERARGGHFVEAGALLCSVCCLLRVRCVRVMGRRRKTQAEKARRFHHICFFVSQSLLALILLGRRRR